ncbi:MAG: hypothetical protein C0593_05260 [Marinilabiliales bacterium]|nr:MAG: hypothetical protein C0593_05260 [Marinilabiliales bacterium]
MKDPLKHFFNLYPYDSETIQRYEAGECYVFVQLKNGRTGVCATLNDPPVGINPFTLLPDLDNHHHRMIYNAWLNATINDDWNADGKDDIFDVIPVDKEIKTIMVGFFRPVVKRFDGAGVPLKVFDRAVTHERLENMDNLKDEIVKADQIIVTSTTIFNGTFFEVLSLNRNAVPVYMLGPSTILHDDMFKYPGVKGLFGMSFKKFDNKTGDIIASGGGTRDFNIFAAKIYRRSQDLPL